MDNTLRSPGFEINVVTTFDLLQQPPIAFHQTAHRRAGDRLHTATSKIRMFASGRRPCSFITSNTAVIASRRFSINSLIVRL
jgi:hypothetical protein